MVAEKSKESKKKRMPHKQKTEKLTISLPQVNSYIFIFCYVMNKWLGTGTRAATGFII